MLGYVRMLRHGLVMYRKRREFARRAFVSRYRASVGASFRGLNAMISAAEEKGRASVAGGLSNANLLLQRGEGQGREGDYCQFVAPLSVSGGGREDLPPCLIEGGDEQAESEGADGEGGNAIEGSPGTGIPGSYGCA